MEFDTDEMQLSGTQEVRPDDLMTSVVGQMKKICQI